MKPQGGLVDSKAPAALHHFGQLQPEWVKDIVPLAVKVASLKSCAHCADGATKLALDVGNCLLRFSMGMSPNTQG